MDIWWRSFQGESTTLKTLQSYWSAAGWRPNVRLIAVLVVLLATGVLSYAAFGDRILPADVHVSREVQDVNEPATNPVVDAMNWFGHAGPFLTSSVVIGSFLLLRGRRWDAAFIVVASVIAQGANGILKMTFDSPRPPESFLNQSDQASGLGFPSGHTMSIVVLLGCLAFITWRATDRLLIRVAVAGTIPVLAIAMGFSRIHVGQHWPSDVLGAYLWGMLLVLALISIYERGATVSLASSLAPARVSADSGTHPLIPRTRLPHYDPHCGPIAHMPFAHRDPRRAKPRK